MFIRQGMAAALVMETTPSSWESDQTVGRGLRAVFHDEAVTAGPPKVEDLGALEERLLNMPMPVGPPTTFVHPNNYCDEHQTAKWLCGCARTKDK